MPLGKYYYDYCDKQFQDTSAARKRHLQGLQHLHLYQTSIPSFSKGVCNRFLNTYGDNCKYFHPNNDSRTPNPPLSTAPPGGVEGNGNGMAISWGNLPPSLKPPPEDGYPPLPFFLNISENSFNVALPSNIWGAPSLQIFSISSAKLTGKIPDFIGCKNVYKIELQGNSLNRSIPWDIDHCEKLLSLNLSRNLFTGIIPWEISTLPSIIAVDLSDNMLTGTIPSNFENCSTLENFNVSYKLLTGPIPSSGPIFPNLQLSSFFGNDGLCGRILPKPFPFYSDLASSYRLYRDNCKYFHPNNDSRTPNPPLSTAPPVRHHLRKDHGIEGGIPVIFSLEKPKAKLLPFRGPSGEEDNPSDYQGLFGWPFQDSSCIFIKVECMHNYLVHVTVRIGGPDTWIHAFDEWPNSRNPSHTWMVARRGA
ncbi:hypothetical protein GOBAR_DD32503 [Gossypium barbadense]|nr:hypothetical protein GOBAR_DD32503 [Gossypium barbadense]